MPTELPPRRRTARARAARPLRDIVLNALMLTSALALTVIVLVQEQRYAMGQPGPLAGVIERLMQPTAADSGEAPAGASLPAIE